MLREVDVSHLYSDEFMLRERYLQQVNRAFRDTGFFAEVGEGPRTNDTNGLVDGLKKEWVNFLNKGPDIISKYKDLGTGGQREVSFAEQSGGVGTDCKEYFTELKAMLHIGRREEEGNPLGMLRGYNFYMPNVQITENPELVPIGEEILALTEKDRLALYEGLGPLLGQDPAWLASRAAYSDTSIRLLYYPELDGAEVERQHKVGGVDALQVYFEMDKIKNPLVYAIVDELRDWVCEKMSESAYYEVTPNGLRIMNLVRAGVHRDIDCEARLKGANKRGFTVWDRYGDQHNWTATKGAQIINAGEFLAHSTAFKDEDGKVDTQMFSGPHAVGYTPDESGSIEDLIREPRVTMVIFGHLNSVAPVYTPCRDADVLAAFADSTEGELLAGRLGIMGLDEDGSLRRNAREMVLAHPFEELGREIVAWEKENKIVHLRQYEDYLERVDYFKNLG